MTSTQTHPFLNPAFNILWSQLTPDHIISDIELALKNTQEKINAITHVTTPTFQNTFLAFEEAIELIQLPWQKVGHLDSVCNSPELRKAYNHVLPQVTAFFTQIHLNEALYHVLKKFALQDSTKNLTPTEQRFINETLKDFKENGAGLSPEKKEKLHAIETELAELTQKYSENVLDSTNAWELVIHNSKQLGGLPQSAIDVARQSAEKKNLSSPEKPAWRFTLQGPSLIAILTYLDDDAIRKQVWEARNQIGNQAPYNNTDLIWKILDLRNQRAHLLGKSHFADQVTARRMAKTGQSALAFIQDLHNKAKPAFLREAQALREFKAKTTHQPIQLLEPWEATYWAEKQRKALFDFDEEELRPYFPIDNVIRGLFELTQTLFGIRIEERPALFQSLEAQTPSTCTSHNHTTADHPYTVTSNTPHEVWHPEVKFYELFDQKSNTHLGSFYSDWFPRDPKRGGAWMNHLITGGPIRDEREHLPHLGLICGNLTPPIGNAPALLTHNEVETIFHEFGHLLHHLLSTVTVRSLSGINVAWDFVELPSQIMENWCWERQSLDLFAHHYQTQQPIPEDLFQKLLKTRTFLQGLGTMRQLAFSKMDLELHINFEKYKGQNLDTLINNLLKEYNVEYKTTPPPMIRNFTHIFADAVGYAAGYYSYKWAEVLDADAFTRFKKEGILNTAVGTQFRETILSKGNSTEPDVLFRNFMGRDPNPEALLIRSGLL
jgi:oligopeptidase A